MPSKPNKQVPICVFPSSEWVCLPLALLPLARPVWCWKVAVWGGSAVALCLTPPSLPSCPPPFPCHRRGTDTMAALPRALPRGPRRLSSRVGLSGFAAEGQRPAGGVDRGQAVTCCRRTRHSRAVASVTARSSHHPEDVCALAARRGLQSGRHVAALR